MLTVVLVVLAACSNAVASVLQRRGGQDQPDARGVTMMMHLTRNRWWLGGIVALVVGIALQAVALSTGPIVLVQPILVLELSFTLLLARIFFGTRLHRREWTAIGGMTVGLAALLYGLQPSGGNALGASTGEYAIGLGTTFAVAVVFTALGYRATGSRRAAWLGLATGTGFGMTAVLIAGIGALLLASGPVGVLTSPLIYLLIVLGPAFFFLLQKSLQAGQLVASQPALTLANPVVAVAFGVTVFGEKVNGGALLVLALAGAALIVACTVLLARSPVLVGPGARQPT